MTSRAAVQPLLRQALSSARMLSAERETELLKRFHADGSPAAMDELVRSHMPIIFRVAGRSVQNPGVDINDLIQTATEGLLIAINRWSFEKSESSGAVYARDIASEAAEAAANPGIGHNSPPSPIDPTVVRSSRLATYALWWMRIMLTNSVINNRGIVVRAKSPKVRKALFGLPVALRKLEISLPLSGNDVKRIAAHLDIAESDIEEALVHAAGDVMLDEPIGDGSLSRGDVIPDRGAEGESGILDRLTSADSWNAICESMLELSPRDRFILITRYLMDPKWKLDRLSATLKMSRERIRQISCDSLARIRARVTPSGVRHAPGQRSAPERIDAMVMAVEQVSASAEPEAMAAYLKAQKIVIGPTRVVNRPGRGGDQSVDAG